MTKQRLVLGSTAKQKMKLQTAPRLMFYIFSVNYAIAMSSKKIGFENSLLTEVVQTGKCASCGTCVVVCPFGSLELAKGKPNLVKECKVCGICAQACPRYDWEMAKAEDFVFGRVRKPEEEFGVFRRIAIAQAKPTDIQKARQDGGAATAMLVAALQNGLIDGAVVSEKAKKNPSFLFRFLPRRLRKSLSQQEQILLFLCASCFARSD